MLLLPDDFSMWMGYRYKVGGIHCPGSLELLSASFLKASPTQLIAALFPCVLLPQVLLLKMSTHPRPSSRRSVQAAVSCLPAPLIM